MKKNEKNCVENAWVKWVKAHQSLKIKFTKLTYKNNIRRV